MKFYYFNPSSLKDQSRALEYCESLVIQKEGLEFVFNVEHGTPRVWVNRSRRHFLYPENRKSTVRWVEVSEQEAIKFLIKYGISMPS